MSLQNQTYANSGSAYYGNPADWSNFSTINDVIRFNDTNATLEVFPAVPDSNTTIAFNGNQLAYVSDLPNLANWAQYPANHNVDVPNPFTVNANVGVITPLLQQSSITILANQTSILGGNPTIDITAQGGLAGGTVNVTAQPAIGGIGGSGFLALTANGGSGLLGTNGFISLTANPGDSSVVGVTSGGAINITANSGLNDAINLTSAVKVSAAGVNIQSGITSPITSVAGYTFIGGNSGVNICGGIPPIIPNVPGTTYIYGTTGIELNSDVYTTRVFPYWSGATPVVNDLLISGRSAGLLNNEAYLKLDLVSSIKGKKIDFQAVSSINISSSVITLNNVSTINGLPYPASSAWNGNATTDLNMNNFNITSTNKIGFNSATGFGTAGLRASVTPPGNFTVMEVIDTQSVTSPPLIKEIRTLGVFLPLGTNSTPPTTYATDLEIVNLNATGRIGVNQYTVGGPGGVSTFTVALQSDPNTPYDIYVSPDGVDSSPTAGYGPGKLLNPYQTIAFALQRRSVLFPTNVEVTIHLASGTYTESFTMARNTYIVGITTGESRQPCNIVGNITMNDTTGSMGLSGLEIVGNVSMTGLGGSYTLFGCNINGGASTAVSATTGSVFITECRISNTAGSCLTCASTIIIRDCVISTTGTGSCVVASAGTSIRQSNISSSSASTGVAPLVNITNSNPATINLGFNRIEYTNTTTDVTGNKCCIKFAGSGVATANIYQSLLLCEGAITGSPQIQCIQDTGAGAVNISYGGLLAGATAHHISPNATKTAFTPVP